jgi:hypothetical protein
MGRTFRTVTIARPFALERTDGGMTLSGPNDCRGSTKLIIRMGTNQEHTKLEFCRLFLKIVSTEIVKKDDILAFT